MPVRLPFLIFIISFGLMCCTSQRKNESNKYAVRIIPRSAWKAVEPRPYNPHVPERITVHHEGTRISAADDAANKIKRIQAWGMGPDRKWADIPYHYLIAPDGTIYEGRDVYTVGETNTEYDPTGHLLITCLGNLEEQEVPEAQLASLTKLIAYCSIKYKIPYTTLATHRDYSKQTSCPGKNLYHYFTNGYISSAVSELLK